MDKKNKKILSNIIKNSIDNWKKEDKGSIKRQLECLDNVPFGIVMDTVEETGFELFIQKKDSANGN